LLSDGIQRKSIITTECIYKAEDEKWGYKHDLLCVVWISNSKVRADLVWRRTIWGPLKRITNVPLNCAWHALYKVTSINMVRARISNVMSDSFKTGLCWNNVRKSNPFSVVIMRMTVNNGVLASEAL
jgi:hypothetical protein